MESYWTSDINPPQRVEGSSFSLRLTRENAVNRTIGLETVSWKILADRCPNFPRGTPTPTSKSTPTPRTRLYQYRWSRIGASKQGKFQPRRGD